MQMRIIDLPLDSETQRATPWPWGRHNTHNVLSFKFGSDTNETAED